MKKLTQKLSLLFFTILMFAQTTPVLADLIDIEPEPQRSPARFLIPLLIIAVVVIVVVLFLRSRKNK